MKRSIATLALALLLASSALFSQVGPGTPRLTPSNAPLGSYATQAALVAAWPASNLPTVGGATAYTGDNGPLYWDGSAWQKYSTGGGGSGTVTSVTITTPAPLTATGCAITVSGTCAITWTAGQTQNQVLASPNGSSGAVALRALVAADIPTIPSTGVSGLGTFAGQNYATPPAIGGTTPAAGTFTALAVTGSTAPANGINNCASGYLCLYSNNALRAVFDDLGNFAGANSSLVSTSATSGFGYSPATAGVPTGVPTYLTGNYAGDVPCIFDSTDNRWYCYANSAWQNVANGATSISAASLPALTGDTTSTAGSAATLTHQIHNNLKSVNNAASPYTVLAADSFIYCDATAGAVVLTLPVATGSGREITAKKIDSSANACTLTASTANPDLIDGAATVPITSQYAAAKIGDSAANVWYRSHVNQLGGDTTGISSANTVAKSNGNVFPTDAAALGDLWYGSAPSTLLKLAGNTTTVQQFLAQTGNGTVSAAPVWVTLPPMFWPTAVDTTSFGIGPSALVNLTATPGTYKDTAIGYHALSATGMTTAAIANTAVGYDALAVVTTATQNTAVGSQALFGVVVSSGNTGVGYNAAINNAGSYVTAIGASAMALSATAVNFATAVGYQSLYASTGSGNTAFGYQSGKAITSGADDLVLGFNTGSGASATITGSNDVLIADSALCLPTSTSVSDEVDICTSSTYLLRITGGATPSTSAAAFAGSLSAVGAISQNGTPLALSIPAGTATFAVGTNVTSVVCATGYSCNNTRGTLTIVGGTATTGTIATVSFSAALSAAPSCVASMNGGTTAFGIGNSAPSTTAFNITAAVSIVSATFNVNYTCQP